MLSTAPRQSSVDLPTTNRQGTLIDLKRTVLALGLSLGATAVTLPAQEKFPLASQPTLLSTPAELTVDSGLPASSRFALSYDHRKIDPEKSFSGIGVFQRSAGDQKVGRSRSTYFWRGALVGGLVVLGATAVYIGAAGEGAIMNPLALAPAVIGGALIGGIIGAAIYR